MTNVDYNSITCVTSGSDSAGPESVVVAVDSFNATANVTFDYVTDGTATINNVTTTPLTVDGGTQVGFKRVAADFLVSSIWCQITSLRMVVNGAVVSKLYQSRGAAVSTRDVGNSEAEETFKLPEKLPSDAGTFKYIDLKCCSAGKTLQFLRFLSACNSAS